MDEYAPNFNLLQSGDRVCCVANMVTYDHSMVNHLMSTVTDRQLFSFSGTIPLGKLTYSLLNVRMATPMPRPVLVAEPDSHILFHDACSWESVREAIEVCSGFGGMGLGLTSVGLKPSVCCDSNPFDAGGLPSSAADSSCLW